MMVFVESFTISGLSLPLLVDLGGPLLIDVPDVYGNNATVKLMVVGQLRMDGDIRKTELRVSLPSYRRFDLGKTYVRSPFWQACDMVNTYIHKDREDR